MIARIKMWYADRLIKKLTDVMQELRRVQLIHDLTDHNDLTDIWLEHLARRVEELKDRKAKITNRLQKLT